MTSERTPMEDPLWEYIMVTKLQPYLPAVRKWWKEAEDIKDFETGVAEIKYDDLEVPPGLQMRMTSTPVRSPIKNVQAFPFLPTAYLDISGAPNGVNKLVECVCQKGLTIEEFTIIEKHNLPSTFHRGQFVAFIPTDVLTGSKEFGKYVYLNLQELVMLAQGICPKTLPAKCAKYIS